MRGPLLKFVRRLAYALYAELRGAAALRRGAVRCIAARCGALLRGAAYSFFDQFEVGCDPNSMIHARRSLVSTVIWLVVAGLGGVLTVYLLHMAWTEDGWRDFVGWPLGLGAVLLTLGSVFNAVGVSHTVACEACGATMKAIDPSGTAAAVIACTKCHTAYVWARPGVFRQPHADEVLPQPGFAAPLSAGAKLPAGCICCGQPATREEQISVKQSKLLGNAVASTIGLGLAGTVGVGFVRHGGGSVTTLMAPHCATCTNGLALCDLPEPNADGAPTPAVLFRSFPRFLAYCALNETHAIRVD